MSKKSLPGQLTEDSVWRESEENELRREELSEVSATKGTKMSQGKPTRQRIEEYFERKRLAEALQEHLDDDIFKK